jgi:hypothetical protein
MAARTHCNEERIRVAKHAVDVKVLEAMKSAIEESMKNKMKIIKNEN